MSRSANGYALAFARAVAIACAVLPGASAARAHVRITNVAVVQRDAKTATIRFDISWQGVSWERKCAFRNEISHTAAWVFFKARPAGRAEWRHVRLAADKVLNPTGYGQDKGTLLEFVVPDGKDGFTGVFLRMARFGAPGPMDARGVTAVWDMRNGNGDVPTVDIRGFGALMVYVAEGPFYLGSGGLEQNGFYRYTDGSQQALPFRVTSAGAIPTGRKNGRLWARDSGPFIAANAALPDGGEIPAAFPNGYAAFYCMKYPISCVQYADFLNTLTPKEANERCISEGIKRSGTPPNVTYVGDPRETRGGSFGGHGLSWADGAAWAAWAGLRPMTELELGKAVRGPREPVPDETGPSYWGLSPFATGAWHSGKSGQGERVVSAGNARGLAFKAAHGRGTTALPADWPQADAVGAGSRCGGGGVGGEGRADGHQRHRVSDRLAAGFCKPARTHDPRMRAVRTAPRQTRERRVAGRGL